MRYSKGAKSFAIRNGTCTLYVDHVAIQGQDVVQRLANGLYGRGMVSAMPLMMALAGLLVMASISTLVISNYFLFAFMATMTALAVGYMLRNRNLSFTPRIEKSAIKKVDYFKAQPGVARARFVIYFTHNGQLLKRILTIPNRVYNGTSLADSAYWMMKDEGYLN